MNGIFNNNFLIGMLLARDLPRQEQFISGLVAGQMPADSPIGPLLLQPLVTRLATEEKGRTSAESNATSLQQPLQVELPETAETAKLSVPGVTTASFTRVGGSPGTTVDSSTGVVALPEANGEETISIAVNGTARVITLVRGARSTNGNGQVLTRGLTEPELAELGRAFLVALHGAALSTAAGNVAGAPANQPPTPRAATQGRSGQRGSPGYTQHEAAAESPATTT